MSKSEKLIEPIFGIITLCILLFSLRGMLFLGTYTLTHDNLNWNYGPFYFFAESLLQGHFPLWNPFTHGGEPFFPLLAQERLLEPLSILTVLLGQFFTHNIEILFNWHGFLKNFFALSGIYLLFRPLAKNLAIRLSLIPILLFSSLMLGSFRQGGVITWFLWAPYIAFFLLKIFYEKDYRWRYWLALSGAIGINFQCYYFCAPWVFLLSLMLGLCFFYPEWIKSAWQKPGNRQKAFVTSVLILLMLLPNIVLLSEGSHFIYPARSLVKNYRTDSPLGNNPGIEGNSFDENAGIKMNYDSIVSTGTHSNLWTFIQLISPDGNWHLNSLYRSHIKWGHPSEAYLYFGILTWFIALVGFFSGKHVLKRLWLFVFATFTLLSLGPDGGLHRVLYTLYPPLWFIRHTAFFAMYIGFAILYFYILGCNFLVTFTMPSKIKISIRQWSGIVLGSLFFFGVVAFLTQLEFPAKRFLFLAILGTVLVFWFLRKKLKMFGLFCSMTLGHLALVFYFNPTPLDYLPFLGTVFFLPVLVFLILKGPLGSRLPLPLISWVLSLTLLLSVTSDLLTRFHESHELFKGDFTLSSLMDISQKPLPQDPLKARRILSEQPDYASTIRYLDAPLHQPSAFSPLFQLRENLDSPASSALMKNRNDSDPFKQVLLGTRADTYFELRNYFNLINLPLSSTLISKFFLIGEEPFQFMRPVPLKGTTGNLILLGAPFFKPVSFHFSYEPGYRYENFTIKIETLESGYLYWADGYDRWWHAKVDGKEVPISRANIAFKAVSLMPGKHSISFWYQPLPFQCAVVVFFLVFCLSFSAMLLIIGSVFNLSRRKRPLLNLTLNEG